MKYSQLKRLALGMIAVAGLTTNFAAAQEAGEVGGKSALRNQIQQQVQGQVQQQVQAQVQEQMQERVQAQLQTQAQRQVQQQVQAQVEQQMKGQLQQQLQTQVQGQIPAQAQLHADAARAGIMAQQAIDNARHQADGLRGLAGGGVAARADTNSKFQSFKGKPLGALTRRIDGTPNNPPNESSAGLPHVKGKPLGALTRRIDGTSNNPPNESSAGLPHIKGKPLGALTRRTDRSPNNPSSGPTGGLPRGFAESDVKIYDSIFGSFNPFRGNAEQNSVTQSDVQVDAGTNNRIATEWQSNQGVVKASATSELDLATRIDSAVHQRRAEISSMRDQAMEESNEAMMEKAEQMEHVLDLFIEARTQAAIDAHVEASAEGQNDSTRRVPVIRSPNSTRSNAQDTVDGNNGQ